MSSDESVTLSDPSDEECELSFKHRRLVKHVATWRSAGYDR